MPVGIIRSTWFAVLLPLTVLLAAALLLGWQVEHLSRLDSWVDHTDQVIVRIDRIQKLLLDQETSLRGYLLTRERDFLQPWDIADRELPETFRSTRDLVTDNRTQFQRLEQLEEQHRVWRAAASEAINDLESGRLPSPRPSPSFVESLRGRKVLMDQMRSIVDLSLAEEQQLLMERRARASARTHLVRWGGGLLLTLVGLIIALFVRRRVRQISDIYSHALAQERKSREAAEALVTEVQQQSLEVEASVRQNAEARELAEARLAEVLRNAGSAFPGKK